MVKSACSTHEAPGKQAFALDPATTPGSAGTGFDVRIAEPCDPNNGDDERNIVNRLTAGGANGVQIEQPLKARRNYGLAIADAVADVYRSKL